jgi:hypothetical protein
VPRCNVARPLTLVVDMTSEVKRRWTFARSSSRIPFSLGRAGARKTRRVILRIAVGWRPPDWRPSGAGLARGTRIFPLNAREGDTTPGRRLFRRDCGNRCAPPASGAREGLALWGQRRLGGHRPHAGPQCPSESDHDLMGVFAACDALAVACAQPPVRLPAYVLEGFGALCQAPLAMAADLGQIAVGPGPCDAIAAGIFAGPTQIAPGVVFDLRDRDGGEFACPQQPGEGHGVSASGFDPGTRLVGHEGGRDHPADAAFLRAVAGEPLATRASRIDKAAVLALRQESSHPLVKLGLASSAGAERDDRGVVFLSDVGHGNGLLMDIPADRARARLGPG